MSQALLTALMGLSFLALPALPAKAAESCPYSLVRYRSKTGNRLGLVAGGEVHSRNESEIRATDVTQLVERLSPDAVSATEARFRAYTADVVRQELAKVACDPRNQAGTFPIEIDASDVLPLTDTNPTIRMQFLNFPIPGEIGILMREDLRKGEKFQTTAKVAGIAVGNRFIPLSSLDPQVSFKLELHLESTVKAFASLPYLSKRGLKAGDVLQVLE